jgi:hypothetical protein
MLRHYPFGKVTPVPRHMRPSRPVPSGFPPFFESRSAALSRLVSPRATALGGKLGGKRRGCGCASLRLSACAMPKYAVVGPLGPEAMDYGLIHGESPVLALRNLHREAVRCCILGGELVFADPVDQALCAGLWRVVECCTNGERRRVEITILPPGQKEGRHGRTALTPTPHHTPPYRTAPYLTNA